MTSFYNISVSIVFLILAFLVSCVSQEGADKSISQNISQKNIPQKFLNPYLGYPQEQFIAAVGTGDTLEQSRSAALSAIAQQVEVSIQSSQKSEESFLFNTAGELNEDISLTGKTNVSATGKFLGVQYGESFQDTTKTFYSIAYINRISVGNIYLQRIEETNKTINSLLSNSESKRGLAKFIALSNAHALSKKNDAMLAKLEGISESSAQLARSSRNRTTAFIANKLEDVGSAVIFSINLDMEGYGLISNEQKIRKSTEFSIKQMLTSLGFVVGDDNTSTYQASINILWHKPQIQKKPTLLWQVSFNITEGNAIILSKTQDGRSQGITADAAEQFALRDIQKAITTIFANYVRKQLM